MGYLDRHPSEDAREGVTVQREGVAPGLNLVDNRVFDNDGNVLKHWPGLEFVTLFPDGTLAAKRGDTIGRFDPEGRALWTVPLVVHHDLSVTASGTLLTLTRENLLYEERSVAFDRVLELSGEDGRILRSYSTFEHLTSLRAIHGPTRFDEPPEKEEACSVMDIEGVCHEYYHANSVRELPVTDLGRRDPRFAAGHWLLSLPYRDLVVILDPSSSHILWHYGPGVLSVQHTPMMTAEGTIVIFDNAKNSTRRSRVVEVDPLSKEIVWTYPEVVDPEFFTATCGQAQRLPNGNTLITESEDGRVIEVTRDGEILWEWLAKHLDDGSRPTVYRVTRIDNALIQPRD